MGSKSSAPIDYPSVSIDHPFTETELHKLWRRFKKLDHSNTGFVDLDDILSIYELSLNPLVYRIFILFCGKSPFDDDDEFRISFDNYVDVLSVFHPDTQLEKKKMFLFKVFDVDCDGQITAPDLFYLMKMMLGENISDPQLGELVGLLMREAVGMDTTAISYEQFSGLVNDQELEDELKIAF